MTQRQRRASGAAATTAAWQQAADRGFAALVGIDLDRRTRVRQLGAERRRRRAAALCLQADRQGRQLDPDRRRRRAPRLHPLRRGADAGRRSSGSRSTCATRRWRSRTSASSSTTGSTSRAACARWSRTSRPARSSQGGSTITMQLMRNLCITDPKRNLERKIQEAKLALEYEERHSKQRDPRPVPEQRLLRDDQRPHRGRRPGGLEDLLLEAGLEADPGAGGAARRAAAGAVGVQPAPQPRAARGSAATRCCDRMADLGYITRARALAGPAARASALNPSDEYFERREPYFFDYVENELIEKLRRQHGPQGRAEGLHDDRPATCRRSAATRSTRSSPTPTIPPRRSSRSTPATATSRRWPRAATTSPTSTTSPPRATASRARRSRPSS